MASSRDEVERKRGANTRADEQEADIRPTVLGEAGRDDKAHIHQEHWGTCQEVLTLVVNPTVARGRRRTYLGRSAVCFVIETEGGVTHPGRGAEVSRGQSSVDSLGNREGAKARTVPG